VLGLAHDVNTLRAPARERARHVEHLERDARTEREARAEKNSRRGFFLVPRYLELGQRLLSARRRRGNGEVRGEVASDSPHQNRGGAMPQVPGAMLPGRAPPRPPGWGPGANLERANTGLYPLYRLSPAAEVGLEQVFDKLGYDISGIVIQFGPTFGNSAFTVGRVITVDADTWAQLWQTGGEKAQRELLAHEITHSIQYEKLGLDDFLVRYAKEHPRYGVPGPFKAITPGGLKGFDVVDPRYSLDELADTVAQAFHTTL
jgi:hypothetical protein